MKSKIYWKYLNGKKCVESPIYQNSVVIGNDQYFLGGHGELCDDYADGYTIAEESKCEDAVTSLKNYERGSTSEVSYYSSQAYLMWKGFPWTVNDNKLPAGCYVEFDVYNGIMPSGAKFNNAETGAKSNSAMPICTKGKNVKDHNCRSHIQII